jgi:beta-xylosidase
MRRTTLLPVLCALALAQSNRFPGSGTSGSAGPIRGDGWGGWRTSVDGVAYRGPYPKPEWSLPFEGLATASAVTRGLLPALRPLAELHIRDTFITRAADGNYYMTGTTGDNPYWFNDGVELWRSADLQHWQYLGLVWSIDNDGTWERAWHHYNGRSTRAVWAPELHYIRGNYVICLAMAPTGIALLRSRTGKPEGPYVNALSTDRPLAEGSDPTLFEDDDGSVYFTYGGGSYIARLENDLSELAEPYHRIELDDGRHAAGKDSVVLFRANGKYYLGAADEAEGRYSTFLAMSDRIYGPYQHRHEAVPGGSGAGIFHDQEGNLWSAWFGNDNSAPFREKPGLLRLELDRSGEVHVAKNQPKWLLVDGK